MKISKRILILLSAWILLLPLTGCGKKQTADPSNTTDPNAGSTAYYLDTLPKNTFGFSEYHVVTIDTNCIPDTLSETASRVDSALFTRDSKMAERYHIDILYKEVPIEAADIMYNLVSSRDENSDVFVQTAQNLMSVAVKGGLCNLNNIDHLWLSGEWWNQSLNKNLTVNQSLYIAAGPVSQWYYSAGIAMVYNKVILDSLGVENVQQTIRDGSWTLEEMYKICVDKNITEDLNRNDQLDVNDKYSISIANTVLYGLFASSGGRFSTVNKNGEITVSLNNEQTVNLLERVLSVFNSKTSYYGSVASSKEVFVSNRALFWLTGTGYLDQLVSSEIDYRIIPCPKYDSKQNDYITCAWPISNFCVGIPTSLSQERREFVGLMTEAYCYISYENVRPAKYESVMKYQVANDPDSSENLDLIFRTLYFDHNLVLDFGGSRTLIFNTLRDESTSAFSRGIAAISGRIKEDISNLTVQSK